MHDMSSIKVRAAKQTDVPSIASLFKNQLEKLPDSLGEFKKGELKKYSQGRLFDIINGDQSVIMVAVDENDGLCGVLLGDLDRGLLWVDWIMVIPEARRMGLGSTLLRELLRLARQIGAHKVWGAVRIADVPAQVVLSGEGFSMTTVLKRHWYGLDYALWERSTS